jgi:transposase-like protein
MRKQRKPDQVVRLLGEADADLAKGLSVGHICRKLGVSENTYYRWRRHQGSEKSDDARRVRELEGEIARLKQLVADLALDRQMLQEVVKKKW